MSDHYRTVAGRREFRHKIDRSEFLGIVFPATSDEEFFDELHKIEKQFFDATHHCWAFRVRAGNDVRARSSDAGEPSGTAGKPILGTIEAAEICDSGIVVARWFGGVKLGTGGLSRAYRETAAGVLRGAELAERYVYSRFHVVVPFEAFGSVYRFISPPDVILEKETFAETNEFSFLVRTSRTDQFAETLTERRLRFTIEADPTLR